ncbi:hypothetical protein B5S32_g2157 [[Candida] boidinii]|nr:hypothetical protein B5S32_g2157 [[Candida] boidinii]
MSIDVLEENLKDLTLEACHDHPTKTKEELALEFFELGNKKELNGLLSEAIGYYRKAYKLDNYVDRSYRNKLIIDNNNNNDHGNGSSGDSKDIVIQSDIINRRNKERIKKFMSKVNIRELLQSYQYEEYKPYDDEEEGKILINILPNDIILNIIKILIKDNDLRNWLNFCLICKKNAYLGLYETISWREISEKIYLNQYYYNINNSNNRELFNKNQLNYEFNFKFNKNWLKLLKEKPFIKFNGIYISCVNYQKEGGKAEFSSAWINPIKFITYYRYYKFFPNGKFLKLLTILEPSKIIFKLNNFNNWQKLVNFNNEWEKKVFQGEWFIDINESDNNGNNGNNKLICKSEGMVLNYKFIDEFKITSSDKYHRFNKLEWIKMKYIKYEQQDDETNNVNRNRNELGIDEGEIGELSIDNERFFKFHRINENEVNELIKNYENNKYLDIIE